MTMKKILSAPAALILSAVIGVLTAMPGAASTDVRPGAYTLSNGVMEGGFELRKTGDSYEAHINLVQREHSHVADFEGPAAALGNMVVINSPLGDDARITITFTNGWAVVEANEEAETQYSGMSAVFSGTYRCEPLALSAGRAAAKYENRRFDYSVEVPENFEALPESANGDGRVFEHRSGSRVSVIFYARVQQDDDDTLKREGTSRVPHDAEEVNTSESGRVYHASFKQGNAYVDSYVLLERGVFYSGSASWPIGEDVKYRPVFHDVFKTWKIRGNPALQ
jgi:hypothetical protein